MNKALLIGINDILKIIIIFVLGTLTVSCSDELSNSKAEKIISDCLEKNPRRETVTFQYGERLIFNKNKEEFKKLKELEKSGYLKIDSLGVGKVSYYGKYPKYNIELLEKTKEFIIEQTERSNKQYVKLLAFDYKIDEVKEVHEIPSMNAAEVRVNYKKVNITPFAILGNKNTTDFKIEKLGFTKTSNGWRYCD